MKPLRIHNENYVYFVTNRTHQQRFFMLPTKENNKAIRYWLAKSKNKYGKNIEIYVFILRNFKNIDLGTLLSLSFL